MGTMTASFFVSRSPQSNEFDHDPNVPPPLKFEVERTCNKKKPLEYNFNYAASDLSLSGLSLDDDRSRSLTPKKSTTTDLTFKISQNSAFTPITNNSIAADQPAVNNFYQKSTYDSEGNTQNGIARNIPFPRSRRRNSKKSNDQNGMPDRETNFEYAHKNPLPWIDIARQQCLPAPFVAQQLQSTTTDKIKIKPVCFKWPANSENLDRVKDTLLTAPDKNLETVIPKYFNTADRNLKDQWRKSHSNSASFYGGVSDTDFENKQHFWHKVFKFEQQKNKSSSSEAPKILNNKKDANNGNFQQENIGNDNNRTLFGSSRFSATVEDNTYRRNNNSNAKKLQKHQTICFYPKDESPIAAAIDEVPAQKSMKTTHYDQYCQYSPGYIAEAIAVDKLRAIQNVDSISTDIKPKYGLMDRNTTDNNVLTRAQLFEKIAEKHQKSVEKNQFFKKLGDYFSLNKSPGNSSHISQQKQPTKTVNQDGDEQQQQQPIKNKSKKCTRSQTARLPFKDNKNDQILHHLLDDNQNQLVDTTSLEHQKERSNNLVQRRRHHGTQIFFNGKEDSPVHEDENSKMNLGEKTKFFELKSSKHFKSQDEPELNPKRVSFLDNKATTERRKFRKSDERRKTQPVTQDEIDKARSISKPNPLDINYQAHRFIQTGMDRSTSKTSITDYYVPNYKTKDSEACQKQAEQLMKCKKVSLW